MACGRRRLSADYPLRLMIARSDHAMSLQKPPIPYCLGIDLGANSLGWAALRLNENGDPVGLLHSPGEMADRPTIGVRVFEEGVENYGQGDREVSRGQKRRTARLQRRQLVRRARRMAKTYNLLAANGWLPKLQLAVGEKERTARDRQLKELDQQLSQRHEITGSDGEGDPSYRLLPYLLRRLALDKQCDIYSIGRAFYHLAQRRGFLSNRKADTKDRESGKVKESISSLSKDMEASGSRTLGEHLYILAVRGERLRKRWTSRKMYHTEFDAIWNAQKAFDPVRFNDRFYKKLWRAIFYQRPLKSSRGLVGTCELEDGGEYVDIITGEIRTVALRRRAPECLLPCQRFRYIQKVNDLAIINDDGVSTPLTQKQRNSLYKKLEVAENFSFADIKKELGLKKGTKLNLQEGGDKGIKGNRTNAQLTEYFGEKWNKLTSKEQDAVVLEIWAAPDSRILIKRATEHLGAFSKLRATKDEAQRFEDIVISSDYLSLSRKAVEKLIPIMEEGISYITAVRRVYGDRRIQDACDLLPPVRDVMKDLRNPSVSRSLNELRRVVNFIIKWYGKPSRITIELARDLKKDKEKRKEAMDRMRESEKIREKAAARLATEAGIKNHGPVDILKLRLWDECKGVCPYSGRSISMSQLFGGEIDIEHIIPFSRCLDDSYINKTLCFADVNRNEKRNRTPFEAFGMETDRFEEMVKRMERNRDDYDMPAAKVERFKLFGKGYEEFIGNFKSSQLNDTRHASRRSRQYLARIYGGNLSTGVDLEGKSRIHVGNGEITALLRKTLGMQQFLTTPTGSKRDDHRHHAIDAVAIALTSPAIVKKLSDAADRAFEQKRRWIEKLQEPWATFREDVNAAVEKTIISFRINNRVRGPLHAETLYSYRRDDNGRANEDGAYSHIRKPLTALSASDVDDIVDLTIRKIVEAKLAGGDPKKTFIENKPDTFPQLQNKDGSTTPIYRVRIRKRNSAKKIANGDRERFVENADNHHLEIYEVKDSKGRTKWEGHVVSLLEAHERLRKAETLVDRREGFVMSLCANDVIRLDNNGSTGLYVIRSIWPTDGSARVRFRSINDARPEGDIPKAGREPSIEALRKMNCIKLTVLPIGVTRPCRA